MSQQNRIEGIDIEINFALKNELKNDVDRISEKALEYIFIERRKEEKKKHSTVKMIPKNDEYSKIQMKNERLLTNKLLKGCVNASFQIKLYWICHE